MDCQLDPTFLDSPECGNVHICISIFLHFFTGIFYFSCGMKSALPRFEKILEPPLQLTKASVPHIEDEFVRKYLASSFHDQF